jgi:hypothetical protein
MRGSEEAANARQPLVSQAPARPEWETTLDGVAVLSKTTPWGAGRTKVLARNPDRRTFGPDPALSDLERVL